MALRPTRTSGEALRAAGALSTVGLAFVLALFMGFWIGDRLDHWLGTTPWLTIVFFFLGLAAGIVNVYRIVSQSLASGSPKSAPVNGATVPLAPPGIGDADTSTDEDSESLRPK